jgi:phosphohistidine phosphatase
MELYLIRHADAVPLGKEGISDDADRPLSDRGRAQCPVLAAALHRAGVHLDAVLTSPLLRARQTAEGLLENWPGETPALYPCNALAPGGKRRKLMRSLLGNGGGEVGAVALVGHMPDLAEFAGWLIGERKIGLSLAKTGCAHIRFDAEPDKGEGTLAWLVTPAWYGSGSPVPQPVGATSSQG